MTAIIAVMMWVILSLISLAYLVFWICMLINAAKRDHWAWFVIMLLLGKLVVPTVLYRLIDYEPVGVRR